MDPFVAGILATCGLIVIHLMVAISIEQSYHRALAAAELRNDAANGCTKPGDNSTTHWNDDPDDPTRRLIMPQDNRRNYTDLQNSMETLLQNMKSYYHLPYTISKDVMQLETKETPGSPVDTNTGGTSPENPSLPKVRKIHRILQSDLPDSNQSNTRPKDTAECDPSPQSSTQSDTISQNIAKSDTSLQGNPK